jgi:very-short-patch-repair endonuclease
LSGSFPLVLIDDFACRDQKLIVEIDGVTHGTEAEVRHDERRSAFLREQGYRILRFWNDDVYKGLTDVCDAILLALAERK